MTSEPLRREKDNIGKEEVNRRRKRIKGEPTEVKLSRVAIQLINGSYSRGRGEKKRKGRKIEKKKGE